MKKIYQICMMVGAVHSPVLLAESVHMGVGAIAKADSEVQDRMASRAGDGMAMRGSCWVSAPGDEGHWLELDFNAPSKVAEVHLYGGLREMKGSLVKDGEIQVREGGAWRAVGSFSGNDKEEFRIVIDPPVEVGELRLWTPQKGQVAVRELAVFDRPTPLGEGVVFQKATHHQVSVNQIAYDPGGPMRFTVPTAIRGESTFSLHRQGSDAVLFEGKVTNGIGDFSGWKPEAGGGDYVIRVKGGGLEEGESFPFEVGPRALQLALLQPMVDFMIDARSVVGTHPSAYGGAAWRDGSYYTHDLASLVMLYLAFPEEIEKMPRQIQWKAERARVLDPGFRMIGARLDMGVLEAVRDYYVRFEFPADEAPDVVKLIHWGLGMTLAKPRLMDPSGDGIGERVHGQLVEQIAYVLALRPRLEKWLPKTLFDEAERFVAREWIGAGLAGLPSEWNPGGYRQADDPELKRMAGPWSHPYKGRHVPGHSILPNLLMYEALRKSGKGGEDAYLRAAVAQAKFVMQAMDWRDPRHTKGHRMSEHKMITGLVWLQRNYPKHAPEGLKPKLEQWADVAISRSGNEWDFRRYDLGDHWSIPVMNEPGNLGGFPACALAVSWVVEDPAKKRRLRELAYAALDCLFGRNPVNAASPHRPGMGWGGKIEKGWPVGFKDGTSAWLETCRGSLSSSPGSEMFPFNPEGRPRHPEGWSAFNAALNVGISYLEFDRAGRAGLPEDCLKKDEEGE